MKKITVNRCAWANGSPAMIEYHDTVWGKPEHDDHKLFQKLILDGFQAGLSWAIIIGKMDSLCEAFDDFKPEILADYDEEKVASLLSNPGIIRNRAKVRAAIGNAKAYAELCRKHGSLNDFLWRFVDYTPVINHWETQAQVPATSELSDRISLALKKEGFKFTGSTIVYAYLQAIGMVNDHLVDCDFRF